MEWVGLLVKVWEREEMVAYHWDETAGRADVMAYLYNDVDVWAYLSSASATCFGRIGKKRAKQVYGLDNRTRFILKVFRKFIKDYVFFVLPNVPSKRAI